MHAYVAYGIKTASRLETGDTMSVVLSHGRQRTRGAPSRYWILVLPHSCAPVTMAHTLFARACEGRSRRPTSNLAFRRLWMNSCPTGRLRDECTLSEFRLIWQQTYSYESARTGMVAGTRPVGTTQDLSLFIVWSTHACWDDVSLSSFCYDVVPLICLSI